MTNLTAKLGGGNLNRQHQTPPLVRAYVRALGVGAKIEILP
jgi:hypothetical protein